MASFLSQLAEALPPIHAADSVPDTDVPRDAEERASFRRFEDFVASALAELAG